MDGSNRNTALLRTAAAFCHPVTIAAVALMLLNDHLFKAWWPGSWATGKLSDAAWVTFAPLFIALPASLLLPRGLKRRDSLVLWLSLSVTSISYFLFNSWEPFHHLVNAFFSAAFGWGPHERDATDSVTLVALALTWWVWWRPVSLSTLRTRALVVGTVAVLATAATSVAPGDVGIAYLAEDGQRVIAASQTGYYQLLSNETLSAYASLDGGLTWTPIDKSELPQPIGEVNHGAQVIASGSAQYRFVIGVSVERSDDGGVTWRRDYDLSKTSTQARRIYYETRVPSRSSRYLIAQPGPLNALVETNSGNLVLAMGQDGVLVRTPDGQWSWATVGPYRLEPIGAFRLLSLTYGDFLLGMAFAVLAFSTVLRGLQRGGKGSLVVLLLTWLVWLSVIFPTSDGQPLTGGSFFTSFLVLVGAFVTIALSARPLRTWASLAGAAAAGMGLLVLVDAVARLYGSSTGPIAYFILAFFIACLLVVPVFSWVLYRREGGTFWRIVLAAGLEFLSFVTPFVLWSQGMIPQYSGALLLAGILGVIAVGIEVVYLMLYERRKQHGEAVERGHDGP